MADWGLDWQLPDYPHLPKLFTSAKTAKKRKHKEFIVTDELLDQPVKLSKLSGDGPSVAPAATNTDATAAGAAAAKKAEKKATKKLKQQSQAQHDAAGPATAKSSNGMEQRSQQKQQKQQSDEQQAGAAAEAADSKQKSKKKRKRQQADEEAAAAEQQQQQQSATAATAAPAQAANPAERKQKKDKKHKKAQQEQQQAAAGVGQGPEANGGLPQQQHKTKSRNKFKQEGVQEQLQQQEAQQKQQLLQGGAKTGQQQQQTHPSLQQPGKQQQAGQQGKQQAQQQQQQEPPSSSAKKKQKKKQQPAGQAASPAAARPASLTPPSAAAAQRPAAAAAAGGCGGSKLLQQFKERLQGSRFRQLNEALYTQPGDDSFAQMTEQPELFQQYHDGFQQQVKSWPKQPLDAAIAWLKGQPRQLVVADFGCGDARLAASVQQTVHSLDLVATAPGVIACNMAHTPLATGSCGAAVFSLALMGTDYGSFLTEAARLLTKGGWLWVAEVRSRFAGGPRGEDFGPFLRCLQQLGFKLVSQDASNTMFVVFVLKKVAAGSSDDQDIKWPVLKACVYKKR